MPCVNVKAGIHTYSVHIGQGLLAQLGMYTREVNLHYKALLAIDAAIATTHGELAKKSLEDAGYQVSVISLTATEKEKNLDNVKRIYEVMLNDKMERQSPVVAVGGGIVGDTAGFAAATYLRGVPLIQVPTTLLSMVDASIGGKTGVNIQLPSDSDSPKLGKNLIGAFWQPKMVLADTQTLESLNPRDYRCGFAECVKHGMIADSAHLTYIAENIEDITSPESLNHDAMAKLISDSVIIKANIVEQDEREAGVRTLLNLGHTFAHALESMPGLDLRHGEAVAIGLHAASLCAVETKRMTEEEAQSISDLINLLDLPVSIPTSADRFDLMKAMMYDKKVRDNSIRLVLPKSVGNAEVVEDVPDEVIKTVWREVGAH